MGCTVIEDNGTGRECRSSCAIFIAQAVDGSRLCGQSCRQAIVEIASGEGHVVRRVRHDRHIA